MPNRKRGTACRRLRRFIDFAAGATSFLLAALAAGLSVDVFLWSPEKYVGTNESVTEALWREVAQATQVVDNASDYFFDVLASPPRPRVAIAMSGGGFRAMTASMAVARGLATAGPDGSNAWKQVTHLSSVSGGSWFSSQLVYSGRFYSAVTDTSKPINEVVEEWGDE
jgi:hypothetical protein